MSLTRCYGGIWSSGWLIRTGVFVGSLLVLVPTTSFARTARVTGDVTGTITAGGSPFTLTISTAGDNARISFSGTTGQRVSLNITGVTITQSLVSILKPDGSNQVSQTGVLTNGKFIDTTTLPVNGTYVIFVDPQSTYTGSMTLTLYDVPADAAGSSSVDLDAPTTLETTVPGQDSRLTFAGLSGQQIYVMRTDVTTPTSTVKVLAPDGSVVSTSGLVGAADGDQGAVLPSDGTYTVLVDGWQTAVGRASLDVSSEEEVPGVYSTDQSSDDGSDEVIPSPVSPQPVSPLGPAAPGTYTTELWDTGSTEILGGLQVVNSIQSGTAAVTGAALNENAGRSPLVGASVTLTDASGTTTAATTDAQGGFAFIDMPAGTYTLEISDPPLGLYRLTNDTYDADTTSQLTAFITDQPQTYDRSQQPDDNVEALPQTPRAYPSFSRMPPTINVLDVKPNSNCAPTISDSSAQDTTHSWKSYVLNVSENEVGGEHYG